MASDSSKNSTNSTLSRRSQVVVGELPPDFLRISNAAEQQVAVDHHTAAILQAQAGTFPVFVQNTSRLSITITQAQLAKNYGLTKMDPYCRVRVGHAVFETQTAHSGSRNPVWNKVMHAAISEGVDSLFVEIFDERAFTMDDRIAWAHITIPERVFAGELVDDWYPLTGRQGEHKEGSINLILSYIRAPPMQPMVFTQQPLVVVPGATNPVPMQVGFTPATGPISTQQPASQSLAHYHQQQQQQQQQQPQDQMPCPAEITEEDVQMMHEMFPNVDDDVIRSILEANDGNKDASVNCLLSMETS